MSDARLRHMNVVLDQMHAKVDKLVRMTQYQLAQLERDEEETGESLGSTDTYSSELIEETSDDADFIEDDEVLPEGKTRYIVIETSGDSEEAEDTETASSDEY